MTGKDAVVGSNPDRAAAARSQNNCTAGDAAATEATDASASSAMDSGATV